MRKITTFLVALFVTASAFAQNTEQKLSEKVTISFPGKPNENKLPNGATTYVFSKDSTAFYMGMVFDLSPLGLTAEVVAAEGDNLWEQMKGPMLAQIPGAVLSKEQVGQFKGKSSFYMELDGSNSTAPLLKGKKAFGYTFFVGSILHQVMFYSTSPNAKADDAKSFFESVVIKE